MKGSTSNIMEVLGRIFIVLLIAFAIKLGAFFLKSESIFEFLFSHILTILLTLLAIHTTTNGIIMTRLKELVEKHKISVRSTIVELKFIIWVQIILIPIAAMIVIIDGSSIIPKENIPAEFILDSLIVSCLIIAFWNLKEVALAIFDLIELQDDLDSNQGGE